MHISISNKDQLRLNGFKSYSLPEYATSLIFFALNFTYGPHPKIVGDIAKLFPEFKQQTDNITMENWERWCIEKSPEAFDIVADSVFHCIDNLKRAILPIDRDAVFNLIKDFVISGTYRNLFVQRAVIAKIAEMRQLDYRLATREEEAAGIDGFVGDQPYCVKPYTCKAEQKQKNSDIKPIYYKKVKHGLRIEIIKF